MDFLYGNKKRKRNPSIPHQRQKRHKKEIVEQKLPEPDVSELGKSELSDIINIVQSNNNETPVTNINRHILLDQRTDPRYIDDLEEIINALILLRRPEMDDEHYSMCWETNRVDKKTETYRIIMEWPSTKIISNSQHSFLRKNYKGITDIEHCCRGRIDSPVFPDSQKSYISVIYNVYNKKRR